MNSGTYTFENRLKGICGHTCGCATGDKCLFSIPEPEPAPTVSLYNLLDHSREDLDILHSIVRSFTRDKIEPIKENVPAHYTSAIAWIRILETAMKEREQRDSVDVFPFFHIQLF